MSDLTEWVDGRRPPAPVALRDEVVRMLEHHDPRSGSVAERLAAAGLAGFSAVLAGPGDRSSAGALLSADALLTYACEAAAEEGHGALERLTRELAPARFARLMTEPNPNE